MAGNKAAIKSRIKSINATKKITGAMELIASAKLSKQRNQMFKNREYSSVLKDTVNQILSGDIDSESVFLKKKENQLEKHKKLNMVLMNLSLLVTEVL